MKKSAIIPTLSVCCLPAILIAYEQLNGSGSLDRSWSKDELSFLYFIFTQNEIEYISTIRWKFAKVSFAEKTLVLNLFIFAGTRKLHFVWLYGLRGWWIFCVRLQRYPTHVLFENVSTHISLYFRPLVDLWINKTKQLTSPSKIRQISTSARRWVPGHSVTLQWPSEWNNRRN